MNARTSKLRQESLEAKPSISPERAVLVTEFYQANEGKHSVPVMRAMAFLHLCRQKTIYLGPDELIVGERGPRPKAAPTFPELTCHSLDDLRILNSRPKTSYAVDDECLRVYAEKIIPYWRGRSMRDRMFQELPPEWLDAYEAGVFTEFMEQRAGPYGARRQDLPQRDARFQARDLRDDRRPRFSQRPGGLCEARIAPRHGHCLRTR